MARDKGIKPEKNGSVDDASKRKNFVRLLEVRVTKSLEGLEGLKHLTNPKVYVYTDEDWKAAFQAITSKLKEIDTLLKNPEQQRKKTFFQLPVAK